VLGNCLQREKHDRSGHRWDMRVRFGGLGDTD
jgi:hypothetical protein